MILLPENNPKEKLIKARILSSGCASLLRFTDLNNLEINNRRDYALGFTAKQMDGLLVLLDEVSGQLSTIQRLSNDCRLIPNERLVEINNYINSACSVLDLSIMLVDAHLEQMRKQYGTDFDKDISVELYCVAGFFYALDKVGLIINQFCEVLNKIFHAMTHQEGGELAENT